MVGVQGVLKLAVLAVFGMTAVSASAQLYKWVDANGVVNYGDWPPDGVKLQPVQGGTVSGVSDRALVGSAARGDSGPAAGRASASPTPGRNRPAGASNSAAVSGSSVATELPYAYERPLAAAAVAADARRPGPAVARPLLPIDAVPEMPPRLRR